MSLSDCDNNDLCLARTISWLSNTQWIYTKALPTFINGSCKYQSASAQCIMLAQCSQTYFMVCTAREFLEGRGKDQIWGSFFRFYAYCEMISIKMVFVRFWGERAADALDACAYTNFPEKKLFYKIMVL